jgi:hypothetical protein
MRKMSIFGGGSEEQRNRVKKSGEDKSPDISFSGKEKKDKKEGPVSVASMVCYYHRKGEDYGRIAKLVGIEEGDVRAIVSEAKSTDVYEWLADQVEY